jgi:ribosomal protein L44E
MAGYGGFPRPQLKGAGKPTKKVGIILRCKECAKAHNVKGFRAKTFEIVEE